MTFFAEFWNGRDVPRIEDVVCCVISKLFCCLSKCLLSATDDSNGLSEGDEMLRHGKTNASAATCNESTF